MSSSTSSSNRKLVRIGAIVLAAMIALEVVTRTLLVPASNDLARFVRYPADARALIAAPGERIALVGNSTTQAGIDPPLLGELLGARWHAPVSVRMFAADGAGIDVIYWMVEHEFARQMLAPDLLIVTFYGNTLEDGERIEVGRLAQFFTDRADWRELCRFDLPSLSERADLLLSSLWMTFAVRDRIKERVLDLIPGYKNTMSEVNAANFHHDQLLDYPPRPTVTTHAALRRFVARQRARGIDVLFVAYPSKPPPGAEVAYEISDEARRVIAQGGMRLLDLRRIGLQPSDYRDNIHVNDAGRVVFTRHLSDALAAMSPPQLSRR